MWLKRPLSWEKSMKQKIKLAFLGGGLNSAIGRTHEIAIKMDNLYTLVGGCFSTDPHINQKTADQWGAKCYKNYDELLQDHKAYDALVILTPTNLHFEHIKQAFTHHIPVISEKTLVSSLEEAQALQKIITKNNLFLLTTYNYTGYPMVRELENMITHGKLGKLIQVNIQMPQESFIRLTKDGEKPSPQLWRLQDQTLSTMALDLGTHLSNMLSFLTKEKPLETIALNNSFGHYDVIDNTIALIKYSNDIDCHMWFSKSALGHKNGLRVEVYGTKGSAMWYQINPEFLEFNDNVGRNILLDRSSKEVTLAEEERYNRFKSGHPAGFIEAFANHYQDIYTALIDHLNHKSYANNYVFGIENAIESLALMDAMERSNTTKKWESL